MELDDAAAIGRARSGDADAFRILVERHSRSLFRLGCRLTGNESDADDVVQETFLRAWKQLRSFDERSAFGTWLYRIASNYALDLLRSRQRRGAEPVVEKASGAPGPERMAMSGQARERLAAAMSELSEAERTAFVLRHHEGLGTEEIAKALGVDPGAAKHSVFRAVKKLRRALAPVMSITT